MPSTSRLVPSTQPEGRSSHSDRAFLLVVLLGTLLRLIALVLARHTTFVSDAQAYVEVAHLLLSGQHFVPYWPSGFPLYLVPFVAAGAPDIVLRASMLFFWAMACWAIWRLTSALNVSRYAWLLLLIYSVMPSSIHMSIEPQTQQPVASLLLLALSAAAKICAAARNSAVAEDNAASQSPTGTGQGSLLAEYILLGLSLGWMSLTRPSALPLAFLIPALCLLVARNAAPARRITSILSGPALSLALSGLIVFAWMARAHQLCGVWMINNSNSINLYFGNNPWTPMYRTWYFGTYAKPGTQEVFQYPQYAEIVNRTTTLPPLAAAAEFKRMAVDYITHNPGVFVLRTLNRIRCFFGFDTFTSANLRNAGPLGHRLFPLSLAAEAILYLVVATPAFFWIAAAPGTFWRRWPAWLLAGTILVYAAPYWLSMSHPTYHYPIVMPLAALGLAAWAFAKDTSSPHYSTRRGWIAVAVLLLIQIEWVYQLVQAHSS